MSTGASREPPPDGEVVRAAARRSLAADGVRFYRVRTRETENGGWTDPWSWEVGVADPAARSTWMRHFFAEASPIKGFAEAMERKWPWLGEDAPPPEPGPQTAGETIDIGREHYYGAPNGWIDWRDARFHGPAQPLWPLEALLGTTTATRAGSADVRGDPCIRYISGVLPGEAASLEEVTLVDRPEPDDDWRAVTCDVCIDGDGLVRRTAWSPNTGTRFKPGSLSRLVMRADRRGRDDAAFPGGGRLWTITELWDYGCDVEITVPTDLIDASGGASLRRIVSELWKMRREYKRAQRGPQTGHGNA